MIEDKNKERTVMNDKMFKNIMKTFIMIVLEKEISHI